MRYVRILSTACFKFPAETTSTSSTSTSTTTAPTTTTTSTTAALVFVYKKYEKAWALIFRKTLLE